MPARSESSSVPPLILRIFFARRLRTNQVPSACLAVSQRFAKNCRRLFLGKEGAAEPPDRSFPAQYGPRGSRPVLNRTKGVQAPKRGNSFRALPRSISVI